MSAAENDPAETIAEALSRLRGRRAGGPGPGGWHGGPHPDHFGHGHRDGDHDHHGDHGHGPRRGERGAHRQGPPWPVDPSGRFGGPARMRMLEALAAASAPLTVSDLGAAIGVDQPRASRLVQQGVALGLVRREADPDDARRTRIALTDEGRTAARGLRGERREVLGRALAAFTDEEKSQLARLLNKLADNWG
ncbi:MarR family winged helix-turn-helix transcriptional regulator [Streptomyces sp. AC495_CC817]|uniref:MarR family winged helix-turn-helix transcriptional regulator n=1 Tax=Streptomyces sp. AC495_CC817 TaxID=2823900 RepID=UPI001C25DD77|nr:MarR family winged helix-turn-helix transcriptional regulator [Streptomyces sp. AC495_CC817]